MTRKALLEIVERSEKENSEQCARDWNATSVSFSADDAGTLLRLARQALSHPAWGPCKTCEFCRRGVPEGHHMCQVQRVGTWDPVHPDDPAYGCGEHKERGE